MSKTNMKDTYELVDYNVSQGDVRPEYVLRNGRALNIYGAKNILEEQQDTIKKLVEDNKLLRDALFSIKCRYEVTDFNIDEVINTTLTKTK